MIVISLFLGVLVVILSVLLYMSVRRTLYLDDKFEELGQQVEKSLDIIDECYGRISAVSETPVFSDEPVVKQLMGDVAYTRRALLLIANNIVTFDQDDEEDETELWPLEKSSSQSSSKWSQRSKNPKS